MEKKKRSESAYAKDLRMLCQLAREKGLSARAARKYAQEHIDQLYTAKQRLAKQERMKEKAAAAWASEEPCGKIAKTMPHMKARAKQESNAALVDTYGKRHSKVIYNGQKTEGPAIVTRKADASARKERERARRWDIGTLARLDAQAERREDCKEHAKAREIKKTWHITENGRKRKLIA